MYVYDVIPYDKDEFSLVKKKSEVNLFHNFCKYIKQEESFSS